MAGSFGYEKENYELSMEIGEQILFPAIRELSKDEELCATGTSCRHQIIEGTNVTAKHPAKIILDALKN
jgi:Fe-S oxidoreductase